MKALGARTTTGLPVPFRARIDWERDGSERIDGTASRLGELRRAPQQQVLDHRGMAIAWLREVAR